jgi:energy-coupling factor transport system permease protein
MNDPRLRLVAVLSLSAAAFLSVPGALLAFLWWLASRRGRPWAPPSRTAIYLGITLVIAALGVSLSGGDGASYLARCTGVLLIAAYAYAERREGELLDVGAWLGDRIGIPDLGFEVGLVGELALGALAASADDLDLIRLAVDQKRLPVIERWISTGTALLHAALRRGSDLSLLLALYGFRGGGVHSPAFAPTRADAIGVLAAISIVLFAFLGPRDIFILSL